MHVVTVNDYLARRDSEWVGQVHKFLGLEVGLVQEGLDVSLRRWQEWWGVRIGGSWGAVGSWQPWCGVAVQSLTPRVAGLCCSAEVSGRAERGAPQTSLARCKAGVQPS